MAKKFSRDYGDVEYREPGEGYSGEEPTPGLYPAKLVSADEHESKNGNGSQWVFELTDGDYEGWRGWVYTDDEGAAWKEQQILVATGLMEPNGDIDMTYEQIVKKAKPVRVRVRNEKYEGERKGKIRTVLPVGDGETKTSSRRRSRTDDDEERPARKRTEDEPF